MELSIGTKVRAIASFESSNTAKLVYQKGATFELVEYDPSSKWCVCRNDEGKDGKVDLENIEALLSDSELNEQLELMRRRIPPLVELLGTGAENDHTAIMGLMAIARSDVHAHALLIEVDGLLEKLLKIALQTPMTETERYATHCVYFMGQNDDVCNAVCNFPSALDTFRWRASLHDMVDNGVEYDKTVRACATISMKLLGAIARSAHFQSVATAEYVDVALNVLGNRNNEIHKMKEINPRAYHLPASVHFISALMIQKSPIVMNNPRVVEVLEMINSDEDSPLTKQFADGTLIVLRGSKLHRQHTTKDSTDTGANHVMISYNWRHQELALKLKESLDSKGYRVWIDVEKMVGNCMQQMAYAVENAAVVLMLYSQSYASSHNCRLEAEYISQLGVDFIPIFSEQGCANIQGLLGILRGQKMYIDFSNADDDYEEKLSVLDRELNGRGKGSKLRVQRGSKSSAEMDKTIPLTDKVNILWDDRKRIEQLEKTVKRLTEELSKQRQQKCCTVS